MTFRRLVVLAGIALLAGSVAAHAAESKHMVGVGLETAFLDVDGLPDALEFNGFSVFGKWGITKNWGILISYRDMEDNEDLLFGEKDSYNQIGVYGVYMWRADKKVRPHIKFGASRVDLDVEVPGFPTTSDDDTAFSIGGGMEAGSQRVAFFADYDFCTVSLLGADSDIGDLTLGVAFKF